MLFVGRFYCKQNRIYSFPASEASKNLTLSRTLIATIRHTLFKVNSVNLSCFATMACIHSLLKNRAINVPIMFPLSFWGSSPSFYLTSRKVIQFLLSSSWIKFIKSFVWSDFLQRYPGFVYSTIPLGWLSYNYNYILSELPMASFSMRTVKFLPVKMYCGTVWKLVVEKIKQNGRRRWPLIALKGKSPVRGY